MPEAEILLAITTELAEKSLTDFQMTIFVDVVGTALDELSNQTRFPHTGSSYESDAKRRRPDTLGVFRARTRTPPSFLQIG